MGKDNYKAATISEAYNAFEKIDMQKLEIYNSWHESAIDYSQEQIRLMEIKIKREKERLEFLKKGDPVPDNEIYFNTGEYIAGLDDMQEDFGCETKYILVTIKKPYILSSKQEKVIKEYIYSIYETERVDISYEQ